MGLLINYSHRPLSRLKKPLILTLVGAYFLSGVLALVPGRSKLFDLPFISPLIAAAPFFHISQGWFMFAPPPRAMVGLSYSAHLPEGWTDLESLTDPLVKNMTTPWTIPRGAERLWSHFNARGVDFEFKDLSVDEDRKFYFQQLSDYFCKGDGKIPDLLTIRFYVTRKGWEPFFDKMEDGTPAPKPADFDEQLAVYEQACDA